MRVAVAALGVETDLLERRDDQRLARAGAAAQIVDLQALGDDLADREARAERTVRVLEDDLHGAAQRPQVLVAEALDRLAVEADGALGGQQAAQRAAQRGPASSAERRVGNEGGSKGRSLWSP